MNFNYNSSRNFVNYQFKGQKVEKKVKEEEKKQEEVKKEESVRQQTIAPKEAKFTAKSEELITNYIIGAMQIDKGRGANGVTNVKAIADDPTPQETVEALIEQWNNLPDDATNGDKIELLTQIINTYENDLQNQDSARIWRVRRETVVMNERKLNRLSYLQRLKDGEPFDEATWHNIKDQPAFFDGDRDALNNFHSNYSTLSDDEKLAMDTYFAVSYAMSVCGMMVGWYGSNLPQYVNSTHSYSGGTFSQINRFVDNPLNEDENWQGTYAQYRTKFTKFQQIMEDPDHPAHKLEEKPIGGEPITAVQRLVNDLKSTIDILRGEGFPYCDELLISIQGYLVYADHDDINVLPNPEGGDGGAKPELSAKVKKASVKDAR